MTITHVFNKEIYLARAKTVQIMLLPKPVGKIAMTSLPLTTLLMVFSCSSRQLHYFPDEYLRATAL